MGLFSSIRTGAAPLLVSVTNMRYGSSQLAEPRVIHFSGSAGWGAALMTGPGFFGFPAGLTAGSLAAVLGWVLPFSAVLPPPFSTSFAATAFCGGLGGGGIINEYTNSMPIERTKNKT